MTTTTKAQLLLKAKRYVTAQENAGVDYQQAVWDIVNNDSYDPLFEGLNEQEREDLENEISLGSE